MADIQKSVGKGGKNDIWDVMVVQLLLNKFIIPGCLPGVKPLGADGVYGNKTAEAITTFQKSILGFNSPDGRVDPSGKTLSALNGPLKWGKQEPVDSGYVRAEKLGYKAEAARLYDFDVDKAELKPGHKLYLTSLRPLVRPNQGRFLIIHGMTSKTGSQGHNYQLSVKRMLAVRDYLVSIGVPASHMCLLFNGEDFAIGSVDEDPLDRAVIVAVTSPPPPPPKYWPVIPPWSVNPPRDDPMECPDDEYKYAIRMVSALELPISGTKGGSMVFAAFQIRNFRCAPLISNYDFAGLRVGKGVGWGSIGIRVVGDWNEFRFPESLRVSEFGGMLWYSTFSIGIVDQPVGGGKLKLLPVRTNATKEIPNPKLAPRVGGFGVAQLVVGALKLSQIGPPELEYKG